MIGPHIQKPVVGWKEAAARFPPGTPLLSVDDLHVLRDAKAVNPGLFTVFRKEFTTRQHVEGAGLSHNQKKELAREYFNTFIDDTFWQQELWRHIDAYKEFNEYIATSQNVDVRNDWVDWLAAVCEVWQYEYRPLIFQASNGLKNPPLVCCSIPVGNDAHLDFARIVDHYDYIMSYHGYVFVQDGEIDSGDLKYHFGRWMEMDGVYRKNGIYLKWLLTESGPYRSAVEGWRASKVYNGNLDACLNGAIKYCIDHIASWNNKHSNRCLGAVQFTTGKTGDWDKFEWLGSDLKKLADFVWSYQPTEVEEPTMDEWKKEAWDYSVDFQVEKGISLNPDALLQSAILNDGMVPVSSEFWKTTSDGVNRAYMPAEDVSGENERRLYFVKVPNPGQPWATPQWFNDPKV